MHDQRQPRKPAEIRFGSRPGRQAGYPLTADMNGFQQEGFGRMDMTVGEGRRCSAANAYLRPAMRRSNLAVRTHALVTRVLFEGRRAVGVSYQRGGQDSVVRARREVIISAGPINSPQLLKLSGVGPQAELGGPRIPVIHDLPGVGENLQDHLEFYFQVASLEPVTLYKHMNPLRKAAHRRPVAADAGWTGSDQSTSRRVGSSAAAPASATRTSSINFLPMAVSYDGSSLAQEHGFQAHVGPMRSKARGGCGSQSPNAQDKPRILFNYLSQAMTGSRCVPVCA